MDHPYIDHIKISKPYLFGTTRNNQKLNFSPVRGEKVYVWRVEFKGSNEYEIDKDKAVLCKRLSTFNDGFVVAISNELENNG